MYIHCCSAACHYINRVIATNNMLVQAYIPLWQSIVRILLIGACLHKLTKMNNIILHSATNRLHVAEGSKASGGAQLLVIILLSWRWLLDPYLIDFTTRWRREANFQSSCSHNQIIFRKHVDVSNLLYPIYYTMYIRSIYHISPYGRESHITKYVGENRNQAIISLELRKIDTQFFEL